MNTPRPPSPRALIARVVARVVHEGALLDRELELARKQIPAARDQGFVQECAYGVLRHYYALRRRLGSLLAKPLKKRDAEIEALLLSGLYQLFELGAPPHAVVDASANACRELDRAWATALVNAILRASLRQTGAGASKDDLEARWNHPRWLVEAITAAYPQHGAAILSANLARPPFSLRVNRRRAAREAYLRELGAAGIAARILPECADGILIETPLPVASLPGFAAGLVSVQDGAAQLAAPLLDARPGQRVLDACAAPGGKAMHLLETVNDLALTALDIDPARLARIHDNARRLRLDCRVLAGDATTPDAWWDGQVYDRILLDAPCSATGVIRRHPDIKLHRRPTDIPPLAARQGAILDALWPLLREGGKLLYATCSILPQENDAVIDAALARHPDAAVETLRVDCGIATRHGRQLLPGEHDMDGFYYCLIGKSAHA